jgi:anti-sigma B factor antagonist
MKILAAGDTSSRAVHDPPAGAFSCTRVERGRTTVVVAAGDVDLATSDRLRQTLSEALTGCRSVVLDCALITFCDCAGIRALLGARQTALDAGVFFALAAVPEGMDRVLQVTGVARVLTIFPTLAAILEPVEAG